MIFANCADVTEVFGSIPILLGGDFAQIAPVVQRSNRSITVRASDQEAGLQTTWEVRNAYELELSLSTGKIHPVFHISLLEPYHLNNIEGRHSPTPPPVDFEETEYHVEKIRTSELRKGKAWYLVSWEGYGPDDGTWEPYEYLRDGAAATVLKFHQEDPIFSC